MRTLFIFLILPFLTITVYPTSTDNRRSQINGIKKDSTYLYADITLPTQEKATSQAYEQLQREVIGWVAKQLGNNSYPVSAIEINRMTNTIITRRADMYRVFAYASKTDILAAFYPNSKRVITSAGSDKPVVGDDNFLERRGGVIEQIKKARYFFELKEIMEPLKKQGDILDYGKYASAKKPEECYLIIYDPAGNIRALLGTGKQSRWNIKTNKDDNLANYRGCGAIWFRLNE